MGQICIGFQSFCLRWPFPVNLKKGDYLNLPHSASILTLVTMRAYPYKLKAKSFCVSKTGENGPKMAENEQLPEEIERGSFADSPWGSHPGGP